jgi:hypothetical protein
MSSLLAIHRFEVSLHPKCLHNRGPYFGFGPQFLAIQSDAASLIQIIPSQAKPSHFYPNADAMICVFVLYMLW